MIASLYLILISLAGAGYYRLIFSNNPKEPQTLAELFYKGFILSYALFCVLYVVVFTGFKLDYQLVADGFFVVCFLGFFIFIKNFGRVSSEDLWLFGSIFVCVLVPSSLSGNTPFLVSDSWSHVSIINRMLDENSFVLSSFSMPNDNFLLKYSPHHAFLAFSAYITKVPALDVFRTARVFYPIVLCLSFFHLLKLIHPSIARRRLSIFLVILIFSILFPTTDAVWRGGADYRIPGFIIMFELLRQLWGKLEFGWQKANYIWFFLIAYAIAVTHSFELAYFGLMIFPYAFWCCYQKKSWSSFLSLSAIAFGLLSLMVISYFISRSADAPLLRGQIYTQFFSYYKGQLNTHITYTVFFVSVFFALCLNFSKAIKTFLVISLAASLILGPLNPILFPLYDYVMGSSHSNRMMYGFPFYIAIILAVVNAVDAFFSESKEWKVRYLSIAVLIIAAVSLGQKIYFRSGLNGEFSYQKPDSYSQIFLYPNLYKKVSEYHHQVIISDVFTSAPINAISNNYVFTNRPWTAGNRIPFSKSIMLEPHSTVAKEKICEYKIDLLIINKGTPESLKSVFLDSQWLHDVFYNQIDFNSVTYLKLLGEYDGTQLYQIERDQMCM